MKVRVIITSYDVEYVIFEWKIAVNLSKYAIQKFTITVVLWQTE